MPGSRLWPNLTSMSINEDVLGGLLPDPDRAAVAVLPPVTGEGHWAGAPSAVAGDEWIYLAYRLRRPVGEGRGYAVVVARSGDGERFETLATITREEMDAESLERPGAGAHCRQGRWRLYLSCATPGTKHWRVEVLEADDPAGFDSGRAPDRAARRPEDGREGPGDRTARRDLAPVGVLPSAGRPRRGRPDGHRLRHQRRRPGVDLAGHGAERPPRPVGRARHPGQLRSGSTGTACWRSTTAGPARRRTTRSGPASPSAPSPARWPRRRRPGGRVAARGRRPALPGPRRPAGGRHRGSTTSTPAPTGRTSCAPSCADRDRA